jgi:hypothetical protein
MGAGAIGKQIQLLLFDAVFHVTPGAINFSYRAPASNRAAWTGLPQPSLGRLVTTKRGLSPLGKISALPIIRRVLLQLEATEILLTPVQELDMVRMDFGRLHCYYR